MEICLSYLWLVGGLVWLFVRVCVFLFAVALLMEFHIMKIVVICFQSIAGIPGVFVSLLVLLIRNPVFGGLDREPDLSHVPWIPVSVAVPPTFFHFSHRVFSAPVYCRC